MPRVELNRSHKSLLSSIEEYTNSAVGVYHTLANDIKIIKRSIIGVP